ASLRRCRSASISRGHRSSAANLRSANARASGAAAHTPPAPCAASDSNRSTGRPRRSPRGPWSWRFTTKPTSGTPVHSLALLSSRTVARTRSSSHCVSIAPSLVGLGPLGPQVLQAPVLQGLDLVAPPPSPGRDLLGGPFPVVV